MTLHSNIGDYRIHNRNKSQQMSPGNGKRKPRTRRGLRGQTCRILTFARASFHAFGRRLGLPRPLREDNPWGLVRLLAFKDQEERGMALRAGFSVSHSLISVSNFHAQIVPNSPSPAIGVLPMRNGLWGIVPPRINRAMAARFCVCHAIRGHWPGRIPPSRPGRFPFRPQSRDRPAHYPYPRPWSAPSVPRPRTGPTVPTLRALPACARPWP